MLRTVIPLADVVQFCDERTRRTSIKDFNPVANGLQVANRGAVRKIGATVDAGLVPFQLALREGVDFLIVHHGLFWSPIAPVTGANYKKLKTLIEGGCALYASHLPLDCHPEIGNNSLLAKAIHLAPEKFFLEYEGNPIALLAKADLARSELRQRLEKQFPKVTAIEFGSEKPARVAILTGSGNSAVEELIRNGVDTLITGELKQQHFNYAQEHRLNLYVCGHYATETFGVRALAEEAAKKFNLEYTWIETGCPL